MQDNKLMFFYDINYVCSNLLQQQKKHNTMDQLQGSISFCLRAFIFVVTTAWNAVFPGEIHFIEGIRPTSPPPNVQ
jgi:hypothetical protein